MAEKKSNSAGSLEGLRQALEALTAQMAALTARLEKLEAAGPAAPAAASVTAVETMAEPVVLAVAVQPEVAHTAPVAPASERVTVPGKAADEFSEELLLVLSAAVAAYLGKRPHIRAIRLQGSSAWAQQGRVFVQASHQLNVPHDA